MSAAKLSVFYFTVLIFLFTGVKSWAKCESCHPTETKAYIHSPYIANQCAECHGGEKLSSNNQPVDLSEVKWFSKGTLLKGTSFISVPHLLQKQTIVFQTANPPKVFVFNPQTSQMLDDPGANNLQVISAGTCGIQNGLWWEAKICTEFNQPAAVEISCDGFYEYHDHWSSFHQITLAGLQEGKVYSCTIKAHNLFGQEVEKSFSFRVKKQPSISISEAHIVQAELYKLPSDELVIKIETDGKLLWRLGELPYSASETQTPADHPTLNTPLKTSLDVCYRCHPDQKSGITHPVKVPLKKGMKHTDLPLEDGLITCISCHEPHTGDMPYLLRKENTALCLSCHDDRYYH